MYTQQMLHRMVKGCKTRLDARALTTIIEVLQPPKVVLLTSEPPVLSEEVPLIDHTSMENNISLMTLNMCAEANGWTERFKLYVVPYDYRPPFIMGPRILQDCHIGTWSNKMLSEYGSTQFSAEYHRLLAQITYVYDGYLTPKHSHFWGMK